MKHFSSSAQGGGDLGRKSVAGKSAVTAQIGISRQNLYYQPKLPAKDLGECCLKDRQELILKEFKHFWSIDSAPELH